MYKAPYNKQLSVQKIKTQKENNLLRAPLKAAQMSHEVVIGCGLKTNGALS